MITGRGLVPRVVAGLLAAAFALGHLCFLVLPGAFEPWNLQTGDLLFRVRGATGWGAPPIDPALVYVQLSDASETELNTAYVSRAHFTDVVAVLGMAGASLQVHDTVFRAVIDEEEDAALVEATRKADNVILGCVLAAERRAELAAWRVRVEGDAGSIPFRAPASVNFAALAAAARGQGFINIVKDRDGVVRRSPLVLRGEDGVYPSLTLLAACVHLGIEPDQVVVRPGDAIVLQGAEEIAIPIDRAGRARINFVGPWGTIDRVSFERIYHARHDALDLDFVRRRLEDRIAIVADFRTAAGDIGSVPLDPNYPLPAVHGSLLNSILTRQFLHEPGPLVMVPLELLFLAALFWCGLRRSTGVFLLGAGLLAIVYGAGATTLFLHAGVLLHLVRPVLVLVMGTGALVVYRYVVEQRRRANTQSSFEAFFPPAVVRRLVNDPERVAVGGQRKELTILFSDIKGFTSRSTTMDPDDVQKMLNTYFEAMAEIVFEHGGTIDKFIGDGLMVFFGDPEPQPDHALRCVRAAIAMQQHMRTVEGAGDDAIRIRVGINTGPVLVGNMGSPRRLSYTVIGNAVNLAARLEPKAPVGGILISESTRAALPDSIRTRPVEPVEAKGFAEPVPAHEVLLDPQ